MCYRGNLESVISRLKEAGASQMECTKTLVFVLKIPLREADEAVINSIAWKDHLKQVLDLRSQMVEASNKIE